MMNTSTESAQVLPFLQAPELSADLLNELETEF
jgi:hypothetical protein